MTTHRYRRCLNCQDTYTYQGSGWGAPEYNNHEYCPTCQEVLVKALRTVPRKYSRKRIPLADLPQYADVTKEHLESWYEIEQENARKAREGTTGIFSKIDIRRVHMGLMNLQTGDSQHVRQIKAMNGPHVGVQFWLAIWRKSGEYEIDVDMEYDIVNDKLTGPWQEYTRL